MQEQTGMSHISTGDLLRAAIASGSPVGQEAHAYMERGELVPDALVINMIEDRLARAGDDPSLHPRRLSAHRRPGRRARAHAGGQAYPARPRDEHRGAARGRRATAQRPAHLRSLRHDVSRHFRSVAASGCLRPLRGRAYQRDDDREETIRARLEVYDKATKPLAAFYRSRGLLRDIDGTGTAAQVLERMRAQLNGPHSRPGRCRRQSARVRIPEESNRESQSIRQDDL